MPAPQRIGCVGRRSGGAIGGGYACLLKVAAVQLNSTADRAANLASADRHTRAAAAEGARLIVLPEKWPALAGEQQMAQVAETLEGPAIGWARASARELGVEIVAGSFLERVEGQEKFSNTCVHVGSDGELKASYRKIHMFDVEVGGRSYRESELEEPGEEIVLSQTREGLGLGLSVCYDLRFPELYRILAIEGAQLLVVPAAFTLATTRDHWEILLRARAIENQCYLIAANQFGEHGAGLHSGGRSMIVDPWGAVLAQAPEGECHIVAEVSAERVREVRERLPSLASRQAHAYRWPQEAGAL
jgi:deaminated glutathione amidase